VRAERPPFGPSAGRGCLASSFFHGRDPTCSAEKARYDRWLDDAAARNRGLAAADRNDDF